MSHLKMYLRALREELALAREQLKLGDKTAIERLRNLSRLIAHAKRKQVQAG